jgi:hypothetical protein
MIVETKAKARPNGRRLVLSLQGCLSGCLWEEQGVCASRFLGESSGQNNEPENMKAAVFNLLVPRVVLGLPRPDRPTEAFSSSMSLPH